MKQDNSTKSSRGISRRRFLGLAAAGLLAGCSPTEQPVAAPTSAPSDTPKPTPVPPATPTSAPTATPTPAPPATPTSAPPATPTSAPTATLATTGRPDVIKFYPDVPSKVVYTHHAGVWNGDQLSPEALRQMLDASITKLTGLNDAREAWAALFKPTEKIAIKVNTFGNSIIWTHLPLVKAVVASLQDAGLPAEQIFIYDHLSVFKDAGYEVNKDGPGVRCLEETDFTGQWKVAKRTVGLSSTLQSCDALINIPVLKSHMISGLTFAMKNHYGSVDYPSVLHSSVEQAIPELNALPPIKDRTRLVIGDILEANLKYAGSWPYWKADWKGDSILMSFDPVAHDTLGMQILERLQTENNANVSSFLRELAASYLKVGAELSLGTDDPKNMEVAEVKLG
jgi:hypothetical protein